MSSKIKYQVREIISSLSSEAQKVRDSETKQRFYKLRRIAESPKSISSGCRAEGKSRGWFNKWAKRLIRAKTIQSLFSKSRKPHYSPRKTRKRIERKICKLRRAQPFLGAERLQDDLKRLYKESCPISTINNILRRNAFIGKEQAKKLTKKHLGKIKQPLPGYLQMDFKYVPYLVQGKQYYQLSVVDHFTSWRLIRIYPEKSTPQVMDFLNELQEQVPFPVIEIQTDNDAAFTDKYTSRQGRPTGKHDMDIWCKQNEIIHKLIPIGQKEINGKVENTHKQDDREFYSQARCLNEKSLVISCLGYNDRWNSLRRTKRLRFKTPNEVVQNAFIGVVAVMEHLLKTYQPDYMPIIQMDDSGNTQFVINEKVKKKVQSKNKTQKKSVIDRYLQYLEWEQKQKVG